MFDFFCNYDIIQPDPVQPQLPQLCSMKYLKLLAWTSMLAVCFSQAFAQLTNKELVERFIKLGLIVPGMEDIAAKIALNNETHAPRLLNVSMMGDLANSDLAIGLSVRSNATAGKFLFRAIGAGLKEFGVQDTFFPHPDIHIYKNVGRSLFSVASSIHDYPYPELQRQISQYETSLGALPRVYGDSAVAAQLEGGSYTIRIERPYTSTGKNVLLEIYEVTNQAVRNRSPDIPVVGNTVMTAGIPSTVSLVSHDSDGDKIQFEIAWSDAPYNEVTAFYPSGEKVVVSHMWSRPGQYTMTVRAKDSDYHVSDWATYSIIVRNPSTAPNTPPEAPSLYGAASNPANVPYDLSIMSLDADDDTVQYGFDWNDDGVIDGEYTDYFNSGYLVPVKKTWTVPGDYIVGVVARDSRGAKSPLRRYVIVITARTE
jgi:hypothetical protein